ncbi:MAG: replicative DNA helicase [Oceanococcaceae bacterium]
MDETLNRGLKAVPHNPVAEQSVLGALLMGGRHFDAIAERLVADDFYNRDYANVWRAAAELGRRGQGIDPVTVSEVLESRGHLEGCGGLAGLIQLARQTPTAVNATAYADIVREHAIRRALISASTEIIDKVYARDADDTQELLDFAEQKVFQIADKRSRTEQQAVPLNELLPGAVEEIRLVSESKGVAGLPTGITRFDEMTTGLRPGDLAVVAGRPAMGKTSLAMNWAEHAALHSKVTVAVFSLEMPAQQLAMRLIASHGRIDQQHMRSGQLTAEDWARINSAATTLQDAKIIIDDTGSLSPQELRNRARRIKREHGLGLILVDYLQLMEVPGSKENRTNDIAQISRGMKSLAKELEVPVIALSQLNRSVESRDNKRPRMSDLRESGGIEQDADLITFIYRDEVYNEDSPDKGTAELIIVKQRNGPIGTVRTSFIGKLTRFENLATYAYEPEFDG